MPPSCHRRATVDLRARFAWRNFFRVQRALQRGQFILRGRGFIGLAAGSLLSSSFSLLIVVDPCGNLDWRDAWGRDSREGGGTRGGEGGP